MRPSEVQRVGAKEVYAAYKKYIAPKKFSWICVSGEEALKEFDF